MTSASTATTKGSSAKDDQNSLSRPSGGSGGPSKNKPKESPAIQSWMRQPPKNEPWHDLAIRKPAGQR